MAKIKFLHTGCNHLGNKGNGSKYNEFSGLKVNKTENGVNVRELDLLNSFKQVMDVAIDESVDFVVNAGDSWDKVAFNNEHTDNFYTKEVSRLGEKGIHYLEVIGNHDFPKERGKGCHLSSLEVLPHVKAVYKGVYEKVSFPGLNVSFHCVPSTFTQEIYDEQIEQVDPEPGVVNIGVSHIGVSNIDFYTKSTNALVVSRDKLADLQMDYFALSDYHRTTDLGDNIWYCGSTERLGLDEIHNTPQVLIVEIDEDTKEVEVKKVPLNVRDMIELPEIDAKDRNLDQVNESIYERIHNQDINDKIVRLKVRNISSHIKPLLDIHSITKKANEEALFLRLDFPEKVYSTKEASSGHQQDPESFKGVTSGWRDFAQSIEDDNTFDKEELIKEGQKRLEEASDEITQ